MMTTSAATSTVNGLIKFSGIDAAKFLQGQLSCDISTLDSTNSLPGAYCSPQGRVRATFILFQINSDEILMILPKEQLSFLLEAMAPYVAFFQCKMIDCSSQWHFFGLQTTEFEQDHLLKNIPDLANTVWQISASNSLYCIRLPGETLRWLCLSNQPATHYISEIADMGAENWQKHDLISLFPWINPSNRDMFLPHDLSLHTMGAISFTKGCYTGQEIVARMQYRGEPKYQLAVLKTEPTTDTIPEKLVQIVDNSEPVAFGKTVESLQLSDNSWLILASVKKTLFNQKQFQLSSKESSILCSIDSPKFIKECNHS